MSKRLTKFQEYLFAAIVIFGGLLVVSAILNRQDAGALSGLLLLFEIVSVLVLHVIAALSFGNLLLQLAKLRWMACLYSLGLTVLAFVLYFAGMLIDPSMLYMT